ncbi:MAG TPA: universal stress protein [Caldimonas sp.]|nr:universal stress protein [Caldimonas sp.]
MPELKSILLHVDATAASITRLVVSQQLAALHAARVTALYAAAAETGRVAFACSTAASLRSQEEWEPANVESRRRLQRLADTRGPRVEWSDVIGEEVDRAFLREAAYADLVVVGSPASEAPAGSVESGFAETMILESGRPVLVLPIEPRSSIVGRRVLVAWDGSAPAARALTASLPILQHAEQVHVASWSDRPLAAPFSRVDVGRYLEEHDVVATRHGRMATTRVADEVLAMATSLDADLVVMGCYGHSRTRERLFGGTSRRVLARMPVALLMAH